MATTTTQINENKNRQNLLLQVDVVPSFEEVVEAIIFDLNRIRDSKERLILMSNEHPHYFSNQQVKNLIQETLAQYEQSTI